MGKIQVWGTLDNGQGTVQNLGVYDEMHNITIYVGALSDDIVITLEEVNE